MSTNIIYLFVIYNKVINTAEIYSQLQYRDKSIPQPQRDSFICLDEDYRELEHDKLSPVKITRTMETLVL
jgi:hypothetical protein